MARLACLPADRARQAGGQVRFLQILHGVLMHFMCHETNNFFSSDFKAFSHRAKKGSGQFSECGQKSTVLLRSFQVPRLHIEFNLKCHLYGKSV
jgi:hypothetical protein